VLLLPRSAAETFADQRFEEAARKGNVGERVPPQSAELNDDTNDAENGARRIKGKDGAQRANHGETG
jgi:hypothetical protein